MNARDKVLAARRRMAAFVMRQTATTLEDEALVVNEQIVLSGDRLECERVRAYMSRELEVEGVVVDPLDPELGEWTCVRIPLAGLELALGRIARHARV